MSISLFEYVQQLARQESSRLHHYYLGVEHLFLALLRLENSLTAGVLKQHRLAPEFVRLILEESLGQSPAHRYWEDYRLSPRYQTVLRIAQRDNTSPSERDLLVAILEEGDSIPTRVLKSLGVDLTALKTTAATWIPGLHLTPADYPAIETDLPMLAAEKAILREMFIGYDVVRVERELVAGSDPARIYTLNTDNSAAIIRFDHPETILREKRQYDTLVTQPDNPLLSQIGMFLIGEGQHLGGLRYDLPAPEAQLMDLPTFAREQGIDKLGGVIHEIYDRLKSNWWTTHERYKLGLWREYEAILPPAIVVEAHEVIAKAVLRPLEGWSSSGDFQVGTGVQLVDFTVERILPHRRSIRLCAGRGDEAVHQSSRVEITELERAFLRGLSAGQSVNTIQGSIVRTRKVILMEQVINLSPNFPVIGERLDSPLGSLPNPVMALSELLQYETQAYLSTIHGSLHIGNILVDQAGSPYLVNYSQTRVGHVLFDWALLEASLLGCIVAPESDDDWASIWEIARQLADNTLEMASLQPIAAIREIVGSLLAEPDDWREYFAALSLVCLSQLDVESRAARRLSFAVAASVLAHLDTVIHSPSSDVWE